MSVIATFGGLTFYGGAEQQFGFFMDDNGPDGWSSGVDNRLQLDYRPRGHGAFGVSKVYRTSRVVTVTGQAVFASISAAKQARQQLAALQPSGEPSAFSVQDDDLGPSPLTISAVLVGAPKVPEQVLFPFFTYAFDVTATDPRKYGPAISASNGPSTSGTGYTWPAVWDPGADWGSGGSDGRVTVSNAGTADSYVLLEVTGQLDTGFEVVELGTGKTVRFDRLVPAGSTVFLNGRTGRAYIDYVGNDVSGSLTRYDFPTVPAGGSTVLQFRPLTTYSGSPILTARVAPAYW